MRHRADRPTTEHKTNSPEQTDRAGLPQALSAVTHQWPICRSVTQMKKNSRLSILEKEWRKPNGKLKSWFHHKPKTWLNEYKETQGLYTVLLSKEGTDTSNSIRKGFP